MNLYICRPENKKSQYLNNAHHLPPLERTEAFFISCHSLELISLSPVNDSLALFTIIAFFKTLLSPSSALTPILLIMLVTVAHITLQNASNVKFILCLLKRTLRT